MSQHKTLSGSLLLAAAAAAGATAALGSAGTAHASCASISGISAGNSTSSACATTNSGDAALAVGPGTAALASGGFNTAIAVNPNPNTTGPQAVATAVGGQRNFALAVGSAAKNALTQTTVPTTAQAGIVPAFPIVGTTNGGNGNTAFAIGNGTIAGAGGPPVSFPGLTGDNNVAQVIGNGSVVGAFGNVGLTNIFKGDNTANIVVGVHL